MPTDNEISDQLTDLGATLRRQPSVKDDVLHRATQVSGGAQHRGFRWRPLAAIAACVVLAIIFTQFPSGTGASEAFAAAIDRVAKARTFSCRTISQERGDDGSLETNEVIYMFKEPDRSRMDSVTGMGRDGEVMITDLAKQRRLTIRPKDKVADLQDTTSMFRVDESGDLVPAGIDTEPREQVLKFAAEAVTDLGVSQLNGQPARVLQSRTTRSIRTVYINPKTQQPLQIVIERVDNKDSRYTFADIKIDQPIDDSLFALDVPAGFELFKGGPYVPAQAYYSKMMTKMRHLALACMLYSTDHKGEFPPDLKSLIGHNGMTEEKLNKLLASPDKPNSPPAIVYRRPTSNAGDEIILYEAPAQRRDQKVAAAMQDCHAEIMSREDFNDAMK